MLVCSRALRLRYFARLRALLRLVAQLVAGAAARVGTGIRIGRCIEARIDIAGMALLPSGLRI